MDRFVARPVVLEVPDFNGRYYVLGLLDFYTNPFGYIGSRTTGTARVVSCCTGRTGTARYLRGCRLWHARRTRSG
jgi:hypothetical protein